MSNEINYGQMMQKAMQGLLKSILERVVIEGLPGEHHFSLHLIQPTPALIWLIG